MDLMMNHKTGNGGVGAVYDRYSYEREVIHASETVAAHIMSIVEGRTEPSNVLPFAMAAE